MGIHISDSLQVLKTSPDPGRESLPHSHMKIFFVGPLGVSYFRTLSPPTFYTGVKTRTPNLYYCLCLHLVWTMSSPSSPSLPNGLNHESIQGSARSYLTPSLKWPDSAGSHEVASGNPKLLFQTRLVAFPRVGVTATQWEIC